MDVLTNERSQNFIVAYYAHNSEIQTVDIAILRATRHPQKTLSMKIPKVSVPIFVVSVFLLLTFRLC